MKTFHITSIKLIVLISCITPMVSATDSEIVARIADIHKRTVSVEMRGIGPLFQRGYKQHLLVSVNVDAKLFFADCQLKSGQKLVFKGAKEEMTLDQKQLARWNNASPIMTGPVYVSYESENAEAPLCKHSKTVWLIESAYPLAFPSGYSEDDYYKLPHGK